MDNVWERMESVEILVAGLGQQFATLDSSINARVNEISATVDETLETIQNLVIDVSTREQVMAGAILDMRADYRTQIETKLDDTTMLAPTNILGVSATRSAAPRGDEVRGLSYVETETGNRTIDLTALFETEQGQPADVDLRSIYDSALFVAKGPVQVRVDTTFREDTDDSLVLYYDFIDATAVKRQVIEIGNNDDAVLTVLMKKTVTLAKFR